MLEGPTPGWHGADPCQAGTEQNPSNCLLSSPFLLSPSLCQLQVTVTVRNTLLSAVRPSRSTPLVFITWQFRQIQNEALSPVSVNNKCLENKGKMKKTEPLSSTLMLRTHPDLSPLSRVSMTRGHPLNCQQLGNTCSVQSHL